MITKITFDNYLTYGAELADICELMEVNEEQVKQYVLNNYGISFEKYRYRKLAKLRMNFIQQAVKKAGSDDSFLKLCLFNIAGWKSSERAIRTGDELQAIQSKDAREFVTSADNTVLFEDFELREFGDGKQE